MQRTIRVSLAVCAGVVALAAAGLQGAKAADVGIPQYQPPPAAYGPPPVHEGYAYPPPPAYVYPPPPPPVAYYYPPAYEVVPDVYYGPGPYWRGGPRFAYGYGHWGHDWGHGHWGHGWHR